MAVAQNETMLGAAAIITAIGGIVTATLGTRQSQKDAREKGSVDCRESLNAARRESEALAAEIHETRMRGLLRES